MANECFCVIGGLDQTVNTTNAILVMTNKKEDSVFCEEQATRLGYRDDGLGGYENSTIYDGWFDGQRAMLINRDEGTVTPVILYFARGSAASPGPRTFTLGWKDATDSGVAYQNGKTWFKYQLAA